MAIARNQTVAPNAQPPDASAGSRVGALVLAAAGIAAIGAFATLFTVWYRTKAPGPDDILRIGLDEYVAGRYDVAFQLAERVTPSESDAPEQYRIREFLVGAAGVQLAFQEANHQVMRQRIAEATPHLERLVVMGFPPGRSAEGLHLLGLGRMARGAFDQAIGPLAQAIAEDPTYERRLLPELAEARLRAHETDPELAFSDLDRFLSLPNLPEAARNDALILRARLHAGVHEWDQAERILRGIDDSSLRDRLDLELARLYIDQARAAIVPSAPGQSPPPPPEPMRERLLMAAELLEDLYHRNEIEYGLSALYLWGIASRLAGEYDDALSILASVRQSVHQPAEAVAAGIEEVELLTERAMYDDAIQACRAIVRDIGAPVMFDPEWLSLEDFRSRLETVAETMREGGAFSEAITLARSLPPIVPEADALLIEARSHRHWGEHTLQAATRVGGRAQQARAEAREHFRNAGRAFAAVARLRFDQPEYVELLWNAIDAYQSGRAFEDSLELLEDYLRYEDRSRLPRGLVARGRSLLAVGRPREALVPLEDCIAEYPRDPLRYEARLLSAIAWSELGEVDQPRRQLEENLFDGRLSPTSPLFRDSLFVLGELLYRRALGTFLEMTAPSLVGGRLSEGDQPDEETAERFADNQRVLEDAIDKLEEAAYRDGLFENRRRSRRASYLAAEAHHLAAYWPGIEASNPETLESARRQLNQQRLAHLNAAHNGFRMLRDQMLADVGTREDLEPWEQAMLRNCFMGVADTMFEIGDLDAAAEAYQQASQEFMNEPLALEALLQQARCYDQLGRDADARRIYQQAAKVLERIPEEEDPQFARTTRYDRTDWQALINWLQQT